MNFCSKCGKEFSEEARFCNVCGGTINQRETADAPAPSEQSRQNEAGDEDNYSICAHCGAKLQEGVMCNCPGAIQERKQNQARTAASGQGASVNVDAEKIKKVFLTGLADLKNFFTSPTEVAHAVAKDTDYTRAGLLVAVYPVIVGLTFYLPVRSAFSAFPSAVDIRLFVHTFLTALAGALLLALLLTIISKAYKTEIPYIKSLPIVAAGLIPRIISWSAVLVLLLILGSEAFSGFFTSVLAALLIGSELTACCIMYGLVQNYPTKNTSEAFLIVTLSNMAFIFATGIITNAIAQKTMNNLMRMFWF